MIVTICHSALPLVLVVFIVQESHAEHINSDLSGEFRQKRSATTVKVPARWVIHTFLKDSTPISPSRLMAAKPGGFRRAILEFKSFKPKDVSATMNGHGVEGTIGDLRVSVQRDGPLRKLATVTILDKNTLKTRNIIYYNMK